MTDERIKTDSLVYEMLHLSSFPSYPADGDVAKLRDLHRLHGAFLVQKDNLVYSVDEDTFLAVKDYNFIRQQPDWLNKIKEQLCNGQIEQYRQNVTLAREKNLNDMFKRSLQKELSVRGLPDCSLDELRQMASAPKDDNMAAAARDALQRVQQIHDGLQPKYVKCTRDFVVMSLATQASTLRRMQARMNALTAISFSPKDGDGLMRVSCCVDGVQMRDVLVTPHDQKRLDNSLPADSSVLKELAVKYHSAKLFDPLLSQGQTLATGDKISAVLQKFYSPDDAAELLRVITDTRRSVDDLSTLLSAIDAHEAQIRQNQQNLDRITNPVFLFPSVTDVAIRVDIDGVQMPVKLLNDGDARDIRSMDMGRLSQDDLEDMVSDLALTYYADELSTSRADRVELASDTPVDKLTRADARTYQDLDKALVEQFPDGLTLQVPDMSATDLFSFVQFGKFRDEDLTFAPVGQSPLLRPDGLQVEVRLPVDKLHELVPAVDEYNDESYEDFIADLDGGESYDASTSELMHRHPDLRGAVFTTYNPRLTKHMFVEGQPFGRALAWILQDRNLDTDTLRTVLTDPAAAKAELAVVTARPLSDYDRSRLQKMNMPDGLDMVQNDQYLYFFEKGVLGFAVVDRARGVVYSGDTLSRASQDFINDFVLNKNIESRKNTFFPIAGAECQKKAYLDTMKDKLVKVDVQQDIYGRTLHTDGTKILSEGDMQHFQDITGRVTDARIHGIDRPVVRCKIDGVQQSGRELTKSDRIRMGHFTSESDHMKSFALSMAVKYFAADLDNSRQQDRSRGVRR